jgi:hypothetical protein
MNNPMQVRTDKDGIPTSEASPDHIWELNPDAPAVEVEPGREELLEFFTMIGGFGARARRGYQRYVPERIRSRTGLVVMSLVVSFAALAIKSWAQRPPSELPLELQGKWSTLHEGYTDTPFWIGEHQVAFQVGPRREDVNIFPVRHITVDRAHGDTTWYTITYAVDGGVNNWSIRHVALPHPAVVFVHQQQMTWTVKPDLNSPVP